MFPVALDTVAGDEMKKRFNTLMPSDCTDSYQRLEEDVSNYLSFVIFDSNSSPSFVNSSHSNNKF